MISGDNNQRGSAPTERRQDHNRLHSYSQAVRSSHDNVISKTHQSGNPLQIITQANLSGQVTGVRPQGSSMPAPTGQVSGAQQMSVISSSGSQVMQSNPARFPSQPQYHQPQQQQRQAQSHQRNALLTARPQQKSVPTNSGVVQQAGVPQNVGPSNLSHSGHQHYYMTIPPVQQIQPQIMTSQHMPHAVPYQTHQSRSMHHQGMAPPANFYYFPNQAFNQQAYANAYAYNTYHTPHSQPTNQMIPQIHPSQRGGQVAAPVIQAPIVQVGSVGANNEMNDMPPQMQQQKQLPKRQKTVATITDPNSGRNISVEELASKTSSKNHSEVVSNNDSLSGASNVNSNANVDIALQFATQVAQVATEPLTITETPTVLCDPSEPNDNNTSDTDLTSSLVSIANSSNCASNANVDIALQFATQVAQVATEPLTITETSIVPCDPSETNDNNTSDTDLTSLVSIANSSDCASNDNLNAEKENIPLNEIKLAQNLVDNDIISQISLNENFEKHDIQQNGETSDLSNQSMIKSDSVKDHQIQKVSNSNQRKKEITKKFDTNVRINSDESVEDIEISSEPNVKETTSELENVELQASQTATSSVSVMSTSIVLNEIEDEKSVINENVFNNLNNNSENHIDKKNAENSRYLLDDTKTSELIDNDITKTDLPIKSLALTLPDLPYKEDQWSPVNPDGKKHYDRAFLIAVKEKTESTLKMPKRLSTMPVDIIRKPHQEFKIADNADPFLPNYANKSGEFRNRGLMVQSKPESFRRSSQPGKYTENKQRKIISTSLTKDVKLHTTGNAWKPTKSNADSKDPEEQETVDLIKKIRGVLNKLTPQKYDSLLKQIMAFKIDTEDRLKRVLDLIFEKAVDEPAFCLQYANLCKHLAQSKVTVSKGDSSVPEEVKFQKLLLSKCQKEFEAEVYASIKDLKNRQKEIEECNDKEKKKALFEILDEDMRRARKRSLGNIKLIGELYKLHMLKGNIMVQCIDKLCTDKDDESLECLCALLKTIGEQLEDEAANHSKSNYTSLIDSFFEIMDKVALQKISGLNTSSRVRFMLRDVIDMRKNGWKPRRDENVPKMIDEIHQEVKKENHQKALELQQHSIQKRQEERDKRKSGRPNDSDGKWTTIPARKSQTSQSQTHSIDWTVMQKSMSQINDVQLGPQGSTQMSWTQGSRGGALAQSKVVTTEDKQVNRFSLLDTGNAVDNRKTLPKETRRVFPLLYTNSRQPDEFELNLGHFSDELQKLVHQKKSKDEVQNFISKYFNVSQLKDPRFTSALFSAVIRGCLTAQGESSFSYTFDANLYIDFAPLLGKFLGGEPDMELQALIVLQKLIEEMEYPAGLLCQIFQLLYDNAVISHDAFLQWEKCDHNSPGKAVAVASVARFLTWLRENEDDDESDS